MNLDVDSEIPLALLLMLRLDVNPLHLRIENLDTVQLQTRVDGRRAACYTVEIIHRSVALSESTCRSRVAHRVSFVGVAESPVETLSNIRHNKPLCLHRTSTQLDARVSDAHVRARPAILTARVATNFAPRLLLARVRSSFLSRKLSEMTECSDCDCSSGKWIPIR